jgi:hypothetical protein
MLKRIDRNGNHKLERDELKEGLAIFGIDVDDSPVGDTTCFPHLCMVQV